MAHAAKFRTGNLKIPCLRGSEMHVDGKTGHGILLEAHGRNKKAVNNVLGTQDNFDFAVHRHYHCVHNNIVVGSGILWVKPERPFPTRRCVFKFWSRSAELAVWSRIAEVPGELHPGYFHAHGAGFCRPESLRSPNGTAHQI